MSTAAAKGRRRYRDLQRCSADVCFVFRCISPSRQGVSTCSVFARTKETKEGASSCGVAAGPGSYLFVLVRIRPRLHTGRALNKESHFDFDVLLQGGWQRDVGMVRCMTKARCRGSSMSMRRTCCSPSRRAPGRLAQAPLSARAGCVPWSHRRRIWILGGACGGNSRACYTASGTE